MQRAHGKQVTNAEQAGRVRPTVRTATAADVDERREIGAARRDLTKYLLSVVNNRNAPAKRRDEMAFCLSKIVATALPKMGREAPPRPPPGERKAKPRVSTYVSKKRQADVSSRTAQKGSSWDGLINGSAGHDRDDDDEDADAAGDAG